MPTCFNGGLCLEQFNRLAPQQAFLVRQALTRCQSALKSSARQNVDEALPDQRSRLSRILNGRRIKLPARNVAMNTWVARGAWRPNKKL
jgi:hypothetical protein